MSEKDRRQLVERLGARVLTLLAGPEPLEPHIRQALSQQISALLEQDTEARVQEIRSRVLGEVEGRWEALVEQMVQRRVAEAVRKIRGGFFK